MPVICPGCATRYALPSHLLGPSGARICCPTCWLTFVIGPDGDLTAVLGRPDDAPAHDGSNGAVFAPSSAAHPELLEPSAVALPAGGSDAGAAHAAHALVTEVLRALDEPPGSLALAEAEGRLFATHGPALLEAFEALAHETSGDVSAAVFRDALFDFTGLDLSVAVGPADGSRPDWHTHS